MVLFTGSPLQISAHVFLCCLLHSLFGWFTSTFHIWYGHCCLCLCTTGLDVTAGGECDASTSLQSRLTDNSLPNDGPFQRTCLKHKTIHQSLGVYRSMLRSFIKIKPQRAGELVPWVRRLHIQACLSSEFEPSVSMEDSWVWQCKGRTVAGA